MLFDNFRCATSLFNEHEYMVVSSAKWQTSVSFMKNIRSFTKRLNVIDPNIDPCGTSLRISRYELQLADSHCVKSVHIRSYSGPYFPAFGLNTEGYGIQSE